VEAARRAEEEFNAEVVTIKKPSLTYMRMKERPPCPSVALNDRYLIQNGTVTFEEIKAAIEAG